MCQLHAQVDDEKLIDTNFVHDKNDTSAVNLANITNASSGTNNEINIAQK